MSKKDYYDILGVSKSATQSEITKAYRSLVKKHHPDKFQGDKKKEAEDRFKEISEAYTVLKDENKRKQYDFTGSSDGGFGGFDPNQFQGSSFFDDMGDVFSNFFGGGGRGRPSKGRDLSFELAITLEQAYDGYQTKIKIPKLNKCGVCDGVGSTEPPIICAKCNGKGTIHIRHGFFQVEQACHACKGVGKTLKSKCKNCSGDGKIRIEKDINVAIPQGIEDGQEIRLIGEGDVGEAGYGDLYIRVRISRHARFIRERFNLHTSVDISPVQAVNGSMVDIKSIEGKDISIKIPAGIQSHSKLRVAGHGMKSGKHKGDLYVKIILKTPDKKKMTEEELKLWELLNELQGSGKESIKSTSFENIKNMFNKWTS